MPRAESRGWINIAQMAMGYENEFFFGGIIISFFLYVNKELTTICCTVKNRIFTPKELIGTFYRPFV